MGLLDEYYDQHAPTSRDRLAAKQAQQQAQADREGVPLETIRYREREALKEIERDAQRQRSTQAAAALASAQATLPPLDRFPPLARQGIQRELTRRELERQREEAEEWARQYPEEARQAAEAARSRAVRWREYVEDHPNLRAADETPRDYDPLSVPEWWT
jgi:hypothetical protein